MILTKASNIFFRQLKRFPHVSASQKWTSGTILKLVQGLKSSPARKSSTVGAFKTSDKDLCKLLERDGVSTKYELIYKVPIDIYMKLAYPTIVLLGMVGPTSLLYEWFWNEKYKDLRSDGFLNPKVEFCFYLGGVCLFGASVLGGLFKFTFRVYKHKEKCEYIAIFLSAIPFKFRQFHFTKATETKFKNPLYLFVKEAHYLVGNKKSILMLPYFRTPADLCKMLRIA